MERTYAKALFDLSHKEGADTKKLVETLVAHLRETGRLKLLPRILTELKRLDARAGTFMETLEVASESEKASAEREAKETGHYCTRNDKQGSGYWMARTHRKPHH